MSSLLLEKLTRGSRLEKGVPGWAAAPISGEFVTALSIQPAVAGPPPV